MPVKVVHSVSDWRFCFQNEIVEENFVQKEEVVNHCDGYLKIFLTTEMYPQKLIENLHSGGLSCIKRTLHLILDDGVKEQIILTYDGVFLKRIHFEVSQNSIGVSTITIENEM